MKPALYETLALSFSPLAALTTLVIFCGAPFPNVYVVVIVRGRKVPSILGISMIKSNFY